MALYLAQRGHDVAVHYSSSQDEAEATVAEIRALGRRARAFQADLLQEAQVQALIPAATAALGPLTVLVNSASIFEYDRIDTATRESWDCRKPSPGNALLRRRTKPASLSPEA
jgi:NAD(P)-dependent dehydrogenase (short-subunit alcohol dehydrogenase family)